MRLHFFQNLRQVLRFCDAGEFLLSETANLLFGT